LPPVRRRSLAPARPRARREDEPLSPRLPVPPYVAERNFHEPIAREEDVLATVERLAARLQATLIARGDGARRLELALFRTDGMVKRIAAGTSRPTRDPQAIRALFVERLAALGDEIDPGFGFDLAGSRSWSPSHIRMSRSASARARMRIRPSSIAWSTG